MPLKTYILLLVLVNNYSAEKLYWYMTALPIYRKIKLKMSYITLYVKLIPEKFFIVKSFLICNDLLYEREF